MKRHLEYEYHVMVRFILRACELQMSKLSIKKSEPNVEETRNNEQPTTEKNDDDATSADVEERRSSIISEDDSSTFVVSHNFLV